MSYLRHVLHRNHGRGPWMCLAAFVRTRCEKVNQLTYYLVAMFCSRVTAPVAGGLAGWLLLNAWAAAADPQLPQATLSDGRMVVGSPELVEGKLVLRAQLAGFAVPASQIGAIKMPRPALDNYPGVPLFRIKLRDGSRLTGTLPQRKDSDGSFRLFGSREVSVPWDSLAEISHRPGGALVLYDSLENEKDAWRGEPVPPEVVRTRAQGGERSLRIAARKQRVIRQAPNLAAGEFECSFFDPGTSVAGSSWSVTMQFGDETVTAVLGWADESYSIRASDTLNVAEQRLRRRVGWHRLRVRFGQAGLRCEIDDQLLGQGKQPAKPLTEVAVSSNVATGGKPAEAYLDDLKFYRHVPGAPGERQYEQDVAFLAAGDEVYGSLEQTRPDRLIMRGKFGRHEFRLSEVQRVALGYRRPLPAVTRGQRVEVRFLSLEPGDTGEESQHDVLSGVLTEISADQLRMEHPWLGTIDLPRRWIVELRPLGFGARLELDPGYHHLGNEARPELRVIEAAGPRLEVPFELRLDRLPQGTTWLSLETEDLEGTRSRHAAELAAGHLRTQVFLNDRLLEGFLNRHVREARQTIRLPVPQGVLRDGKNTLRIIQKPAEGEPNQFDDCGIARIALEIDEE